MLDRNTGWLWIQCNGVSCLLELIWGTQSSFLLLQWPQVSSRLVKVFLGTPCFSIKEVKAPFVFDVGHGIALHAMQGNRASSRGEGEVSLFFSCCGGNLGYILEL